MVAPQPRRARVASAGAGTEAESPEGAAKSADTLVSDFCPPELEREREREILNPYEPILSVPKLESTGSDAPRQKNAAVSGTCRSSRE